MKYYNASSNAASNTNNSDYLPTLNKSTQLDWVIHNFDEINLEIKDTKKSQRIKENRQ